MLDGIDELDVWLRELMPDATEAERAMAKRPRRIPRGHSPHQNAHRLPLTPRGPDPQDGRIEPPCPSHQIAGLESRLIKETRPG